VPLPRALRSRPAVAPSGPPALTAHPLSAAVDGAKPYPYDAWPGTGPNGITVTTNAAAANTVAEIEASLSPQQMQQFQQLQAAQRRKLMQGKKTQDDIAEIGELNQVDGAKAYPYDAWPGTGPNGVTVTTNAAAKATVEEIEASLSPEQLAQFQQLQQAQQ